MSDVPGSRYAHPPPGEEIVISGMAGSFPKCDNLYELRDKLFAKENLITADNKRSSVKFSGIPPRFAQINNVEKFDREFFNISVQRTEWMDPMGRMLLEKSYEAIVDAGLNPNELRGSQTGVYIGSCFTDAEMSWFGCEKNVDGNGILGFSRNFLANWISWWLDLKGPSYNTDAACASSLFAIEAAYRDLRDGTCDYAIVGSCNLCFSPITTVQFAKLGVLAPDGISCPFDARSQGYVRSEAISVVLLQKANMSKRIYARIVHCKTNCDGYKPEGITFPSHELQAVLFKEFYAECNVKPETVSYVETHGTGTNAGDSAEAKSIGNVFTKNRIKPLQIGTIKSNMGHSEGASGAAGLSKALIVFETGMIPPNINYISPRENIPELITGKLQVVTEPTKLDGSLVGINSFGFGGANGHLLLERHNRIKERDGAPLDDIPRLVAISGRTMEAVEVMLSDVESRPLDAEFVRLLHDIHKEDIRGHKFRGYSLLQKDEPRSIVRKIDAVEPKCRPVYFVFGGVGSQWPAMASSLMVLPPFMAAIRTCDTFLQPMGIDIKEILTSKNPQVFDNIINTVVAIAAVQIGLVDVLTMLGVRASNVLGYSIGELGCAYAENQLSVKDIISIAYLIGRKLQTSHTTIGSTHFEDVNTELPVKAKQWYKINFDNKISINDLLPYNSDKLKKNNRVNQRIFEENFKKIDLNAIVIEVGPNALFQHALRTKAPDSVIHVVLTRANFNNTLVLLKAVGTLYNSGLNPSLATLYPDVQFPVARGTPMISPLVRWDHKTNWRVPSFDLIAKNISSEETFSISVTNDKYSYLQGHVVDGRNLFPATGYLELVWELFAKLNGGSCEETRVVFEDVSFNRATNLPKQGEILITVMIQRGTGNFEVSESKAAIVTGKVRAFIENCVEMHDFPILSSKPRSFALNATDCYKISRRRGCNYAGLFKGISNVAGSGEMAEIEWNENWVSFMDNLLQVQILLCYSRDLVVPVSIRKLIIDPHRHMQSVWKNAQGQFCSVHRFNHANIITSGGIEIQGLEVQSINRKKPLGEPVLEKQVFVSYFNSPPLLLGDALRVCLHLALDITPAIKVKVLEVDNFKDEPLASMVQTVLGDLPLIQAEVTLLSQRDHEVSNNITLLRSTLNEESNAMFVIHSNLSNNSQVHLECNTALKQGGYIISREQSKINCEKLNNYDVLTEVQAGSETFVLMRLKTKYITKKEVISISNDPDFPWLTNLKRAMQNFSSCVLFCKDDPHNGIIGLVTCLRKELPGQNLQTVFILDKNAPQFDVENSFYKEQLDKGLPVNIYEDGEWGSLRHLQLVECKTMATHAYVDVITRGDLSSLSWLQGPCDPKAQQYVDVHYSALNFRDIMMATGKLRGEVMERDQTKIQSDIECNLGFEYSGIDQQGRRVMCMVRSGGLATGVLADPCFTFPVPDSWSLEEAATVPVVYATVIRALVFNGMRAGHKVLIHAGSGGVGLAAITLALHYGCTVFTTVGTPEKKSFVLQQFPELEENNVGNSRDSTFEQMIMARTNGQGVDFVLNSLSDDKLHASLRCLGVGGKFLEIGKFDMTKNTEIDMGIFTKGGSFHSIMLDKIYSATPLNKKRLRDALLEGIRSGAIKPLKRRIYKQSEIEQAFRYMAAGKHMGKVLVDVKSEYESNAVQSCLSLPRLYCQSEKSCIVVGGLGGFGLELTHWLIGRGLRKVVLSSRRGVSSGYQQHMFAYWNNYGVQVQISTANVATVEGCRALLRTALAMGPVDGIFNLAVVLRDALLENQTVEKFREAFAGKALATQHLDQLSREMCAELRHFVVFSSVSCGRGNAGQSNYGMANSVMERVCERRHAQGLPALAVQWGAIGEVGLVADMQENDTLLEIGGTLQQSLASCLQVLDVVLTQREAPVVASMVVAEKKYGGGQSKDLVENICSILGLRDVKTVSIHSNLPELGMDSMMSVEIQQTLEREYEIHLSSQEIRLLTMSKLLEYKTKQIVDSVSHEEDVGASQKLLDRLVGEISLNVPLIVQLPSLAPTNDSRSPLIFIPGIEGRSIVFKSVCKNLNLRTFSINIGTENLCSNVMEIVDTSIQVAEAKLQPGQEFNIVGYSYGTLIAIELALRLEAAGQNGRVLLLDGGPLLTTVIDTSMDIELSMLRFIMRFLNITKIESTMMEMAECKTWESKLDELEKIIRTKFFRDNIPREIWNGFLCRYKALAAYTADPSRKIKAPLLLIKPKTAILSNVAADYGLSVISTESVQISVINGDHYTLLDTPELPALINSFFIKNV